MTAAPRARTEGLFTEEIAGEVVVYDTISHSAHCLNAAAALIWRGADGARTEPELAALLHAELGLPASSEIVRAGLSDLERAGLLAPPAGPPVRGCSRRELAKRAGLTAGVALALPLVTSIVAPTPAAASSAGSNDQGENNNSQGGNNNNQGGNNNNQGGIKH